MTPLGPGLALPLLQAKEIGSPCPPVACQTPGTPAASEGSTLKKGHGAAVGGPWAREDPSLFTLQMGFVWSTLHPLPLPPPTSGSPMLLTSLTPLPPFLPPVLAFRSPSLSLPILAGTERFREAPGPLTSDIAGKQHTSHEGWAARPNSGQTPPCCEGEFRRAVFSRVVPAERHVQGGAGRRARRSQGGLLMGRSAELAALHTQGHLREYAGE